MAGPLLSRSRAFRLFAYLALPGLSIPTGLEAQACLGFARTGFLGPAVGLRLQGNDSLMGVGGVAGFHVKGIAARAQVLRFSLTDNFQGSPGFVFARADVAPTFSASGLPLCPVMTVGSERVPGSGRDRNAPMWGLGLASGHAVTPAGSDTRIIPSLLVALENSEIMMETAGAPVLPSRQFSAVVRGGITFGFTDAFIRPYVAVSTLAADHVIGGVAAGLTF